MKTKKQPKPAALAAATTATGADVAQEAAAAMKKERNRLDFSKTILRPGGLSAMPEGTKSTLG